MKDFPPLVFLSFLSFPLCTLFLPIPNFPQDIPFNQLIIINHDLSFRFIQTLYLHLTCSSPLHTILFAYQYPHIHYFQHPQLSSISPGCPGISLPWKNFRRWSRWRALGLLGTLVSIASFCGCNNKLLPASGVLVEIMLVVSTIQTIVIALMALMGRSDTFPTLLFRYCGCY